MTEPREGELAGTSAPAQPNGRCARCTPHPTGRGRYRRAVFDENVIAEAAKRLAAAAPGAEVILFGSHARGSAGPGSDLDFLIVEPSVDDAAQEAVRLRRTLRGLGVFADVLVVSKDEAQAWRDVRGSVIQAALAEGRPLAA